MNLDHNSLIRFIGAAAVALTVCLIVAGLQFYGVIAASLGRLCLIMAGIIAWVVIVASEAVWSRGRSFRIFSGAFSAAAIFLSICGIDGWARKHQPQEIKPTPAKIVFDSAGLQVESDPPRIGQKLSVRFDFYNIGQETASDVQTWGVLTVKKPDQNHISTLRPVWMKMLQDSYLKFKGRGMTQDLISGKHGHNYGSLDKPLTRTDFADLRTGKSQILILLGGFWVGQDGQPQYWMQCYWAPWNIKTNNPTLEWKNCD